MKSKKNGNGPAEKEDEQNSFGYDKNTNLTPLKILIFSFFGALQCGFTYLPNQIVQLGFNSFDTRVLILTTSLIAIIGVLLIGFLLDFISRRNPTTIGKWLKFLLIVALLGTSIIYALLAFFPTIINHFPLKVTPSSFSCDEHGANLIQNTSIYPTCESQPNSESLKITNCSYECKTSKARAKRQVRDVVESSEDRDYLDTSDESGNESKPAKLINNNNLIPPHICHDEKTYVNCHVYLENSIITLRNVESSMEIKELDNECLYPLNGFSCQIPTDFKIDDENETCIESEIQCSVIENQKDGSFDELPYYVVLVTLGQMFPALVIFLIIVTMIIATREMECQRGNISRLWIFVPLGILVFSTISGVINHKYDASTKELYFTPFLMFAIVSLICVFIVLFSRSIFNSPSTWWWMNRCGMLSIPLSSLKRYRWLIFSFVIVCLFTGVVWNVIESYRHIILVDLIEREISAPNEVKAKTFVYILGSLIAIPVIWNGEKIVDVIGHAYIIVLTLISFALRFSGLTYNYTSGYNTFYEMLDPFSFYLSWFSYVLIIRHFVPKKFLCSGSAIFISVYFLLGRGLGFAFGVSTEYEYFDQKMLFGMFAAITTFVAILFLSIYYCLTCARSQVGNDDLTVERHYPDAKSQQRVFHDERSKKGYFRY